MKRFLSVALVVLLLVSVFPAVVSASETYTSVDFDRELARFTVTGSGFNSTDNNCVFMAAGYNAAGDLMDVQIKNVPLTANNNTEFNAVIDFTNSTKYAEIKKVKTMLWDSFSKLRPIISVEEFDVSAGLDQTLISGGAAGARVHISLTDATYEYTNNTNAGYLTDGDLETKFGAGSVDVPCYIFLDLGKPMQIDKVATTVTEDRAMGQKYYLSNAKPSKTWDAATDGVLVGTLTEKGTTIFTVSAGAATTEYRYVIADATDPKVGGYIHELEVYGKEKYTIVSSNGTAYKLNMSNTTNAATSEGTKLTDGVYDGTTNRAGFGINTIPTMTWLDLGEAKQIDKVKIYVSDGRSVGQEYYLSNVQPSHTWTETDGVLLGTLAAMNGTVTLSEYELTDEQVGKYRFIIVKTETSTSGGYIDEIEAYEKNVDYNLVSSNAPAYRLNCNNAGNAVINHNTVLTDGIITTDSTGRAGFGVAVASMTWVDLEEQKQIDKVVISTSSDGRSKGQKYYLSNTAPSYNWTPADGVLLGTCETHNGTIVNSEYVLTKAQAGKYRYIIMVTDSTVGGHLTEIKAYAEK